MHTRTKNIQDRAALARILQAALPGAELAEVSELSDGFFNVAYRLTATDGREAVVKVAPAPDVPVMSSELDLMHAEVTAMRLVAERDPGLPAPRVIHFDPSGQVCAAPYVVMSVLPGVSLAAAEATLTPADGESVRREVGRLTRRINAITGPAFGYLAQPARQGPGWADVFTTMLDGTLADAELMGVDLGVAPDEVRALLRRDRTVLDEVRTPRLVHWDLWAGNVFVADGAVTGLIDWERSLWGDPLLEVGFRTYADDAAFLEGYGRGGLTPTERRRALWYDVYLLVIAAQEGAFRHYATTDIHDWATGLLPGQVAQLARRDADRLGR